MNRTIDRNHLLQHLKEKLTDHDEVKLAIIFGSIATKGESYHDIDIAVRLTNQGKGLLALGELAYTIAKALDVNEERVDIVDIDQAPTHLLQRILREGLVVKGDEETIRQLHEKVKDYPELAFEVARWANLDPEPKADKIILESRVAEVRRNADFLNTEILNRSPEELKYKDVLALERAIHRIIEAMLDVCRHLVAVHSLGLAESYGEYPDKLANADKMPKDLAKKLSSLAGLRNIIVHRYLDIRLDLLYDTSKEAVNEVAKQFIEWIKRIDP